MPENGDDFMLRERARIVKFNDGVVRGTRQGGRGDSSGRRPLARRHGLEGSADAVRHGGRRIRGG
jgi:hypothetical protein